MRLIIYAALFISALGVSLLLVPLARETALRLNILDQPGERKIHSNAKPYLGGVAIYLSFTTIILAVLGAYYILRESALFHEQYPFLYAQLPLLKNVSPKLSAILAGGTILTILGVIDDIKGAAFSAKLKFFVQAGCALLAVLMGIRITFFAVEWLDLLISFIWITGITNAFNLLDNMDGLSAGVAAISGLVLLAATGVQGQFFMACVLAVFVGSIIGFLKYNYSPSKIFMGDAGSLFIGFTLGSLTISASYVTGESSTLLPALMPVIILSIPLFDTISVILIRIREKRPIYIGDKRHLSHRLVEMGFSTRNAVNMIYLMTILIGASAFLLPQLDVTGSIIVFVQTLIVIILISVLMFVGKKQGNDRS